ncbi:MAG: alpha-2-macroglobulin, partial [Psychroserpens sp.]|nr:alpha-2-macroglobulin [Psychroserpens sp.]
SLEVVLPSLDNGFYLIVAKTETNVFSTADIQVTDMALIETQETSSITYQLVNRNNGKPISDASVKLHYRSNRNIEKEIGSSFTTDDKGQFTFIKNNNSYYSVYATVKKGNETGIFGESYINRLYKRTEKNTIDYRTFIITDRSIYRPGQTVYFKGITTQTRDKSTTVLEGETITALLYDVNGQELNTLNFTTNEYGSFHGEFILPIGGLTGNFRIETYSDKTGSHTQYFSVEEYKRPKFETNFDPITESYKINDSIIVHGKAIAFAGSNITDAKVVYRVKRQVRFPNWYYWRGSFNNEAQEITYGESLTDSEGKFEITFKALPDDSVSKENLPIFTYEVSADVTDLNGETRSATTMVNVGYHALLATVNAPQRLNKSLRDNKITIKSTNLNNEFVAAKGTLKIYKLLTPNQVLRPRPWEAPDYKLLSQEAFKSQYPNWAYENESDYRNWQNGDLVFKTDFDTEASKTINLKRMNRWQSGKYRIELESEDIFGQAVTDISFVAVYSNSDTTVADQSFFEISLDKTKYKPDENAELTFGTAAT